MAEETINILRLQVEGATSVADLRNNVKQLKEELKSAEEEAGSPEGWEHYQQTLELLKQNQAALKDALNATTGSFDDVKKAARGATNSYNALANKMADLKREFRATNDEARRSVLADQINQINDQLKEMDALTGNFQRNVGNYQSAFKGLSGGLDALDKSFKVTQGGVQGLKGGMDALAANPWVAVAGLLIQLCMKLADELKENDKAMASIKKMMESLQPVMDAISQILGEVVDFVADLISQAVDFLVSNGIFNKIIQGVMGVGNAILKYVTAPFKAVIAAIKVFKEEGISGLGNAARAFGQEMKSGYSFKANYEAGVAAGDAMLQGMADRKNKKKAKKTGQAIGKTVADAAEDEMEKRVKEYVERVKRRSEAEDYLKTLREKTQADLEAFDKELDTAAQDEFDAFMERLKEEEEAERLFREKEVEMAKEAAEQKKDILMASASATSDILGAIADLYEADSDGAVKNAKHIKALRIASATIDTISGAIGAYMQAVKTYPAPYGAILGAVQAATVTATGIANIAKIRATDVSKDGGGDTITPTVTATTAAPSVPTELQSVRTLTSASDEARLNRMASDQKVYLVTSELEMKQNGQKVSIDEATF